MGKSMHAPNVKTAVRKIISAQKGVAITNEKIIHRLLNDYQEAVEADSADIVAYGLGVAVGQVAARPTTDPAIRDLFDGDTPHDYVNLRGPSGGKVSLDDLTLRMLVSQPKKSRKVTKNGRTSQQALDAVAEDMMAEGCPLDTRVLDYLAQKRKKVA